MKARYYVGSVSGFTISPNTGSPGRVPVPKALPTAYYVYDRVNCHKPVARFPAHESWPVGAVRCAVNQAKAVAMAARLNAAEVKT